MKPYKIKGATMPLYCMHMVHIVCQYLDIGIVLVGVNSIRKL